MLPTQPSLLGPDDLPSSPNRSLVIHSTHGRPLSKEERAFNRALERVQALTRALGDGRRRLDGLLVFHATEIRPRIDRAVTLRAGLVRALAPFLDDRRLTKAQHVVLQQILIEQLDDVLAEVEKPDEDLQVLFERLHGASYGQTLQDQMKEAQAGMAAMFDEFGLDVDLPEWRADMTEEEAAAAAAQFADELRRAEASREPEMHDGRYTKGKRGDEDRARRDAQLRKDSISAVYRRLVKELHPDLERDPLARENKSRVMQDITAAYTRGDLHALLQLEVEWLVPGSGDPAGLSADKLRTYTDMLKEQAKDLDAEMQSLRFHPRYAALIVEGPFGEPTLIDGPRETERLNGVIEQVAAGLQRLSSTDALQEVRGAIREYRDFEQQHARTRRRRR